MSLVDYALYICWLLWFHLGMSDLLSSEHSFQINITGESKSDSTLDLFLPWWLSHYRICLQFRRPRFDPWVGKIPWRREWCSRANRRTCSTVPCSDLTQEGSVVRRVSDSDQWYQPLFLSCGWMSTGMERDTRNRGQNTCFRHLSTSTGQIRTLQSLLPPLLQQANFLPSYPVGLPWWLSW